MPTMEQLRVALTILENPDEVSREVLDAANDVLLAYLKSAPSDGGCMGDEEQDHNV